MAGDWIKMRSDLFTHPKVVRISSALKADTLRTVGGLMSVWCLFDAHSVDGELVGYTKETLDSHVRWDGFSSAMESVGWLIENDDGLELPNFESHNGQSAKRRAQDADRKKESRKMSALNEDKKRTREEKRREDKDIGDSIESTSPSKNKSVKKPDGVSDQLWSDLKSVWKTKRKPVTETAIAKIEKVSHETGVSVPDVVLMIVENTWQGVESEWVRNKLKTSLQAQQISLSEGQKRTFNGEAQTYYKLVGWVSDGRKAA